MTDQTKPPNREENQAEVPLTGDLAVQAAILKAIQASTGQTGLNGGGYTIEKPAGVSIWDFIFNRQDFKKHQEMMNYLRFVAAETMEGMNAASAITVDYFANSLETESAIDQIIRNHKDSAWVLAHVADYASLAHLMQMQTVTAIAQSGMSRIKNKIEHR
jgi:hypothetical protein